MIVLYNAFIIYKSLIYITVYYINLKMILIRY